MTFFPWNSKGDVIKIVLVALFHAVTMGTGLSKPKKRTQKALYSKSSKKTLRSKLSFMNHKSFRQTDFVNLIK